MNWWGVSRECQEAANRLTEDCCRSCVNRAYYAVYARATHALAGTPASFPLGWEGPSHLRLRALVENHLTGLSLKRRRALSSIIGELYALRCQADYQPSREFGPADSRTAISLMRKAFDFV